MMFFTNFIYHIFVTYICYKFKKYIFVTNLILKNYVKSAIIEKHFNSHKQL